MAIVEQDDPRLVFMPETEVMNPDGIVQVYRDRWWIIHPEKGLAFWRFNTRRDGIREASPLCNSNQSITEDMAKRMYPWAKVNKIPVVLKPINPHDY